MGLGSKAQIGKDYAAEKLKSEFDIERIAFADELKKDLSILFKQSNLDFEALCAEPDIKKIIRPLMVTYGQIMRTFNADIWVDRALANKEFTHQVTIITDVRFPNEVARLKALGGVYIEIDSNVPPANETEALYSPIMSGLADYKVTNNFDGNYLHSMAELIETLLQEEDQK